VVSGQAHDDPDAPRPTSIVITASAFVLDDAGRLLMIRRTVSGLHALSAAVTNSARR
jgi:hypothetical protein